MSWQLLGTLKPGREWQRFVDPLASRLVRLSYAGDETWLIKYQPRAYLRLRVGDEGFTQRWVTLWPKSGLEELLELFIIPLAANHLEIRSRRNFESLQANYLLTVEQYLASPYLIGVSGTPLTINGQPFTVGGVPVLFP